LYRAGLGKPARFAPHIAPGGPRVRRTVCLLAPMRVRVEAMTDAVTVRAVARARSGFDTCRVVRWREAVRACSPARAACRASVDRACSRL